VGPASRPSCTTRDEGFETMSDEFRSSDEYGTPLPLRGGGEEV